MATYEKTFTAGLEIFPRVERLLAKPPRIAIKAKGRILFVDPAEIMSVEAQGNYVLLRRKSGEDLLRGCMSSVTEKLAPYGFVRIHRSVAINGAFVEEILTSPSRENVVRLKGGMEFSVSRTYRRNLHAITPLWIGTNGFHME
ncbi:MAG: LytTR family DNA-binding domain-containing protein [Candidatus Acidiferrum sp.]